MKQKITLLLVMMCLFSIGTYAQTQFWSDDFESNPSSGTRTPEVNGGTTSSYFRLTDGSNISQVVPFTGKEGNSFWAGEDHNGPGTGFPSEGATPASNPLNELQIEWTGINISGKSDLSFRGLIAAASTNEPWDNQNACISGVGTTNTDYIIVEYSIDGGAYVNLIRFYNRGSASGTGDKYLFEDTNNDGCGDGTQLTNVFGEFTKTIVGTGTTMSLRIRVFSEGSNEEWGIDNFRLFEAPVCNVALTPASQTNIACNGGATGAATVNTATGGTAPYTYDWTPGNPTGDGTTSVSGLTAGTWTCTVTDANACTASVNFTVTQPTAISLTAASQTNISCNGGANGAASVNTPTGGAGGYTYNWTPGNPTGDGTASVSGLTAGTWTCTVTDANACTASVNFTVTQPTAISLTAASQTNISCNGGANGAASVNTPTGGAGGYTYNWTPGNPTGDGTASVSGLTAGTWTCTVTDANACTASVNFTVTQPTAISLTAASQTNISCNGGANGAASVNTPTGGAGGYTYNWTPGNPTGDGTASVSGLTAGTWTCTVTDANACTASVNFTVTQPTAISLTAASQTNISCNGGSNGAASVNTPTGGAGGYTYNWTPGNPTGDGTASVTGLSAGTWTCTVTDANACTASVNFTVTQPTAISLTAASQTNISCNGGSNGAASVNTPTGGAGGYTYNWTPGNPTGDGTASVSGLTAGTWTCTVTDANACTASVNFTVTQPTAISLTPASQTNIACNGGATGAATVNAATGGTAPYTYDWTPGNPIGDGTTSVSGLTAGTWTCTVTDANSCTTSVNFTVTQPTALVTSAIVDDNVSCNGGTNGGATASATGGTAPYSYLWSNAATTATITGVAAGTYNVTITDANGCTDIASVTITEPTALVANAASDSNASCNGATDGGATASATGGTAPYSYLWSNAATTATITGVAAGTYNVTITDANGCTDIASVTITEPVALVADAASDSNASCNGATDGGATASATGGTAPYSYLWSNAATTATITGVAAGTYNVTITDANGCTDIASVTITEPVALVADAVSDSNASCNGATDGGATASATGGTAPYSYLWSNAATTATITGVAAGTYNVTITDANGCTDIASVTITEPVAIDDTISELTTGILTANEVGATYQWYECPNNLLTGETNQDFTPTTLGDYKVEVTVGSCTVQSTCYTVTALGTSTFENKLQFAIYPNPTSGLLNIDTNFDGEFLIVNQLGQTVKTFKVNSNIENIINVENLADGIYYIKGTNGTQISSQNLIIKK
ncbi:beta strand repeat-containing protein [Flavobacterium sp. HNIBRBA15423]|uniref:beta strand repeat-containing protein n=1 Tax=Flavobacterium sp. HNIBRBA15423 TaxID=3458683 RepID=UPI004043BDAA